MNKRCCEFLVNQIAFYNDAIRPCCSFSIERNNLFEHNYTGDIEGIKKYLEIRENYIRMFQESDIPPCYDGCTIYNPKDSDDCDFKLNTIIVSHKIKCSFNCIYCEPASYGNTERRKHINQLSSYDIMPVFSYLKDCNLIAKGCRFIICGGECSEYPQDELARIFYFAISLECELLILSSASKYSAAIAQALKAEGTVLKISVDSGTKETFEKIKRVRAFNSVWKNIKSYIEVTRKNPAHNSYVELKYIIIPGINDNIAEASAFIKRCREVGCLYIRIDVEHGWIYENKYNKEKQVNVSKVINFFFDELYNDENIKIDFEGVEKDWLWAFVTPKYNIPRIGR